ncbi:hypothetical protein AJ80_00203 [Polytolypa hystricis UAMH7299]|uniref:6-phosphogluconate dehydrogenase NADP-binding domain-containing protein n=1 Tax=Polytolypa hystricis (strain UAMH7299) TaxID=1447883 RepID=A0A2B7Z3Y1_POLH7|nr:hypothetical protein AJ80_00203 [Polytolypa hystricis UAMH7299]
MVKNLVSKAPLTSPVLLYNRTQSRATTLAQTLGPTSATVAPTLSAAITPSSIIFLCLGDDAAVEQTLDTAITTTSLAGKLFVDCSTVHPDMTRKVERLLESHGASFVACPVFGAPAMADAGKLICVLAGKKEAVARVKPYCANVMGRANLDLSETSSDPGRATMLKVLGNTIIFSMVEAVAEGMVVAEKSGLGTDALHSFLELMFPGPYVGYSGRMISGDYFTLEEPLFAVDLARKDVRHAIDMAGQVGARMKGTELVDEHLKEVKKEKGEKGDIAAIYGVVRKEAGMKFENKE